MTAHPMNPVSVGDDLVERLEFKAQVAFDANKKAGRRGKEWAITEELEWKVAVAIREAASQLAAVTAERDALATVIDRGGEPALMARIIMASIENKTNAEDYLARATTAEAQLKAAREAVPDEIDIYQMLKREGLRKRADIAKFIAATIRTRSPDQ